MIARHSTQSLPFSCGGQATWTVRRSARYVINADQEELKRRDLIAAELPSLFSFAFHVEVS